MRNPLIIGLVVYALLLAGAFAGWKIRNRLPAHHLADETKSLVSMSTAVVATVSALVLGLLISNANTTFTRLGGEVTSLSAEILRLDQILRRYGSAADPARGARRGAAGPQPGANAITTTRTEPASTARKRKNRYGCARTADGTHASDNAPLPRPYIRADN